MNDFVATLLRWAVRISLMLVGLVFFLCLMAVAAMFAMVWGARLVWARLTGRPATPWTMLMSPRSRWQTVYRSGAEWMAQAGSTQRRSAAGQGGSGERRGLLRGAGDVTDVQPREVHES